LLRECTIEELPNTQITLVKKFFGKFTGTAPHTGDVVETKVYFVDMEGDFVPAAEISESRFFTHFDCVNEKLSDATRKIADELKKNGYL